MVGAIAMTEPGAGSDLQGISTRAKLNRNGDYILNGSKVGALLYLLKSFSYVHEDEVIFYLLFKSKGQ